MYRVLRSPARRRLLRARCTTRARTVNLEGEACKCLYVQYVAYGFDALAAWPKS